jgi:hopanoid-associated phosphorylase
MQHIPTVLCVTGLAAEARIARAVGFDAVIGAGNAKRTLALARDGARRAQCLVSFGIAGALAPSLRPGDAILTDHVITDDRSWCRTGEFHDRLSGLAGQIGARRGPVLGAQTILASREAKLTAWQETGASAVDMESAAVAEAADAAGIPFLILRAIADPATRTLPPAALIPLREDGTPALAPILAEVLRRPQQIPGLIALARETRLALAALVGPARALHGLLSAVA